MQICIGAGAAGNGNLHVLGQELAVIQAADRIQFNLHLALRGVEIKHILGGFFIYGADCGQRSRAVDAGRGRASFPCNGYCMQICVGTVIEGNAELTSGQEHHAF